MKRLAIFRKQVIEGWTVQRIAAVLIVVGVIVFVAGVVNKHCACAGWPDLGDTLNDIISDFYANVSVDCLSVAFAILVIDQLNEQREEVQLKEQLIREMGSRDNGIALRAVDELRARGWLEDGSLRGISLYGGNLQKADLENAVLPSVWAHAINLEWANLNEATMEDANLSFAKLQWADLSQALLQRADLSSADLRWANLSGTNMEQAKLFGADLREANPYQNTKYGTFVRPTSLRGAVLFGARLNGINLEGALLEGATELTDLQLVSVIALNGATMPDGRRYDGRYNLYHDLRVAQFYGNDPDSLENMAAFYRVQVEAYLAGQEWAREHLVDLRREAGLDPDTGLPVEPTNGTEPQPDDTPAPPAARRDGHRHRASMVAHRGRW